MSKVKKKRRLTVLGRFVIVLFIGILFGASLGFYYRLTSDNVKKEEVKEQKKEEEVVATKKEMDASLVMVGDALIHYGVYKEAETDNGYDFKPMLSVVKPMIQDYDLKYYNQETILGGTELGLSSYPRFNSPYEVGDAFVDAGFNLVSLATNHTMDKGEVGVINSLNYWNSKEDVYTAGSYLSNEDRDEVVIKEINGITYSFFSYTTWTNGLETPSGKEYLNNVYSPEKAKADIEKVRDKVDVVIVAMHWGTEYSFSVSSAQQEIANYLSSLGVDIIIGSHPHVVEPIAFIGKTMVIYSLGNFISDQDGIERLTGLMVGVDIHKTVDNGVTTIELRNPRAELLYTASRQGFIVYPYTSLNDSILPNYKSYYETYKNIVLSLDQSITMPSLE
ncbi:MAG TPA: CapA family protein [Candidatus Onthousia faecipullorum]|uniref:CapA family protein n=1 Tax=Candidatus Onthousia faecipullorum TaxID=2840887 RepID=A0A9D1KBT9_9FIRM|nr:CapA family protein [Candidatus Onthousia faecipullorum]